MSKLKMHGLIMTITVAMAIQAKAAQESTPVGYTRTVVPSGADRVVSVPISDQVDYTGSVSSISGNEITVSGTPFVTGAYTNGLSYVRFTSGANAGLWATITNNTASTLLLKGTDPANLSTVSAGHRFVIQPHTTLSTMFPASDLGKSFVASTSTLATGRKTEVLLVNTAGETVNRGATTYFYFGGWRRQTTGTPLEPNTIVPPQQYVILRNRNNTGSLVFEKVMARYPWVLGAPSVAATVKNDNPMTAGQLGMFSLYELDLVGSGAFTPSTSTLPTGRKDELLVFNPIDAINLGATTYFCTISTTNQGSVVEWRRQTTGTPVVNAEEIIEAGSGFIVRRAAQGSAVTNNWVNAPTD
jgi:uncharacterized protein (TIGR02597 family)